ncbi:hypothetical protein [Microvirga sp. 2TAF3]|uniref:hypothetical protein n=1 Tax=Microvirga sp. 2TAF3 TaxID=3233014 RepID=UPI003F9B7D45
MTARLYLKRRAVGVVVLAGIVMPSGAAPAGVKSDGAWDYTVKSDYTGDPQMVMARLRNQDGSALWISCTRRVGLDLETSTVSYAATVTAKRFLGSSEAKGRSTVYWFDENPPEVSNWIYRDRYGQLRDPEAIRGFVRKLVGSEKLVIELSNYRYEGMKSEFKLERDETRAVTERFSQDCGSLASKRT